MRRPELALLKTNTRRASSTLRSGGIPSSACAMRSIVWTLSTALRKLKHHLAEGKWARRQEFIEACNESTKALTVLEAEAQEAAPELAAAIRRREEAAASLKDAAEALSPG